MDMSEIHRALSFLKLPNCAYKLPGKAGDKHIIPCSGGADSSAMAVLLHWLFPSTNFILMFTDTKAEGEDLYENLTRLEEYLQKKIHRVEPELGLFELIDKYNGFLPNSNSRWCTRELKLKTFEAFMATLREGDEDVYSYVGVRADETQRIGLLSHDDWIHTEMPFRDLGIGREEVFQILSQTVGVPRLYSFRTRSGCICCPFQRRAELVGQLLIHPGEYQLGQKYEKLTEQDMVRFPENADPIWRESGLAANHLTLPLPKRIDVRTSATAQEVKWGKVSRRKAKSQVIGLFDAEQKAGLWVGAEFFVHAGVGDHGVWMQRLVTYSSTRAGLKRQLQSHYEHRIQTPEIFGLSVEEMKEELKLAMYYIEVPTRLMDTGKLEKGSFTWIPGESYSQRKHLLMWAARTLHAEGLHRMLAEYEGAPETSWRYEQWECTKVALERVQNETGEVLNSDLFVPVDQIKDEEDERLIACFHCSI